MLTTTMLLLLPAQLEFLGGCWAGETDNGYLEEQYGSAHGGSLLGTVKTIRNGQRIFFEFIHIHADDEANVWLKPWPNGKADAPRFRLVELEADKAAFENARHDYPRRIVYRLLPNGQLMTQVAGRVDGEAIMEEYVTSPRECGRVD